MNLTSKNISNFLTHIIRGEKCWIWIGGKHPKGYGRFSIREGLFTKTYQATRIMYFITYGVDPGELDVLHNCDNPACVNPEHFFLGTEKDNYEDSRSKGRNCKGESHGNALYSDEIIKAIRYDHASEIITQEQLSRRYGINRGHISKILNFKARKELT